ncbi:MAG: urease accessory protein UreE [Desulfovibrio sp.]|nr:urease accessory protein UreE [Desulfovibrio sp.]
MQLVEHVLGNVNDVHWKEKLVDVTIDVLELSQWDAQKNRLRKQSRGGRVVAVSLERDEFLHNGDVLVWDEESKTAVVCKIDLCEVLVVELEALAELEPGILVERSVALGHALGNQHWPAVVREGKIYVPMSVDRAVMNSVMNTHHFAGVRYSFVPGEEVAGMLSPAQSRRLFGGSERPVDARTHGHSHKPVTILDEDSEHEHKHHQHDGHGEDHHHKHEHKHAHEDERKHKHGHADGHKDKHSDHDHHGHYGHKHGHSHDRKHDG